VSGSLSVFVDGDEVSSVIGELLLGHGQITFGSGVL